MGANVPLAAPVKARPDRLEAVDLLRGVVMVIMALDHVRDFFSCDMFRFDPTDLGMTTPAYFLTRWITHYCAPTFIFLAGTGAFLSGTRGKSKAELSWFLLTRGLWLAFLEVTLMRMLWMFNYDLHHHGAGVFWAIGWSMVALSGLVYLPTWAVTLFGVVMIASHNLLDGLTADQVGLPEWLWVILHSPGDREVVAGITFGTGYCLIPWNRPSLVPNADRDHDLPVVSQLHQVSAVAALPVDDTWPGNHGPGVVRSAVGSAGATSDHFWPSAALLLRAAHSAHPRGDGAPRLCAVWLVASGGRWSLGGQARCGSGIVRSQPADGISPLDRRRRRALPALLVVRGSETAPSQWLAELLLTRAGSSLV
jgi:hypothetical protein